MKLILYKFVYDFKFIFYYFFVSNFCLDVGVLEYFKRYLFKKLKDEYIKYIYNWIYEQRVKYVSKMI